MCHSKVNRCTSTADLDQNSTVGTGIWFQLRTLIVHMVSKINKNNLPIFSKEYHPCDREKTETKVLVDKQIQGSIEKQQ